MNEIPPDVEEWERRMKNRSRLNTGACSELGQGYFLALSYLGVWLDSCDSLHGVYLWKGKMWRVQGRHHGRETAEKESGEDGVPSFHFLSLACLGRFFFG